MSLNKLSAFLIITQMMVSTGVYASTVYTFTGTIDDYGYQQEQAAQYYETTYGVGVGLNISFSVEVDFQRQGEETLTDGTVEVLQDIPIHRNCDTCYGSSGNFYDYASLISSSIDTSLFNSSVSELNYTDSNYYTGMAMDWHEGKIHLGDRASSYQGSLYFIRDSEYWSEAAVFNWEENDEVRLYMTLDDGNEQVKFTSYMNITGIDVQTVPLPSSLWLLAPALVGLFRFKRKTY